MTPEQWAVVISAGVAGLMSGAGVLGTVLVRWLDPEVRAKLRKDALDEWKEIAGNLEKRLGVAEEAAKAAKTEADQTKTETAQRRVEQDAAIEKLTTQVNELTVALNERAEQGAQREQALETKVALLEEYVEQLKTIMQDGGLEVPPMPQGIKPKRRRRRGKPMVKKESGGGA